MSTQKSLAYILSAQDYRETSRLLRVFTETHGRLSLIGKGVRGPKARNAHAFEPFHLLQISWSAKPDSTLGNLYTAEVDSVYPIIRTDLAAYAQASTWFELLNQLLPELEPSPGIFKLTNAFFDSMQDEHSTIPILTHLPALFRMVGFDLPAPICGKCGSTEQLVTFDPTSGEWACLNCPAFSISGVIREPLAAIAFTKESSTLSPEELKSLLRIFHSYLVHHLERPLRTWTFLERNLLTD